MKSEPRQPQLSPRDNPNASRASAMPAIKVNGTMREVNSRQDGTLTNHRAAMTTRPTQPRHKPKSNLIVLCRRTVSRADPLPEESIVDSSTFSKVVGELPGAQRAQYVCIGGSRLTLSPTHRQAVPLLPQPRLYLRRHKGTAERCRKPIGDDALRFLDSERWAVESRHRGAADRQGHGSVAYKGKELNHCIETGHSKLKIRRRNKRG